MSFVQEGSLVFLICRFVYNLENHCERRILSLVLKTGDVGDFEERRLLVVEWRDRDGSGGAM